MSDPTSDPGMMAQLLDKAWAFVAAMLGVTWKANEAKHKETRKAAADALDAHAAEDAKEFKKLNDELLIQRSNVAKLFDRIEDHARRSEERHHESMQRAHESQRELLMALNSKADRHA